MVFGAQRKKKKTKWSSVQDLLKVIRPYYINYGELNIVKNKIDKSIPKIKKRMIQLQRRDIISFLNSKYVP